MSDPFTTLDNVILYALAKGPMSLAELSDYTGMARGDLGMRMPALAEAGEVAERRRHESGKDPVTVWERVLS